MRRLVVLVCVALAVPAGVARAAWQPAGVLEGPDALVAGLGGVAVARDGTGAVVMLRHDGVVLSRLLGGAFTPPGALGPAGTEARVAAGDGGRLAVAWIAGGTVLASAAPDAATGFSAPVAVGGPGAENLDIDIGVDGVAYAVWEQGGDVRAARLQDLTWTPLAAPLDIDPADTAGTGALRPRVAVDAAGNALVVWGEAGPDGRTHVEARRLIGTALSAYPQDATLAGGNADSPDVSTEYNGGFEWVVFRQDVGGASHTFARHFLGATFDPPVPLDGGAPSDSPRVSINGGGDGAAVYHGAGDAVAGPVLANGVFGAPQGLGSGAVPDVSATDNGNVAAAWLGGGQAYGAFLEPGQPFQPATPLGPADAVALAGDRVGDYVVASTQGPDGARAVSVAVYDRPPGRPAVPTSTSYARRARPRLSWGAGLELWGGQTFQVMIDGKLAGTTTATTFVPPVPLRSGRHTVQIVAVDRVGQATPSHTRTLRVDALAPRVSVHKTLAGRVLRLKVRARDRGGSGLDHVTVAFGDGHSARGTSLSHVYRRRGRYTLRVSAVDRAGNTGRRSVKLRIR